ncbi:hypothetical protein B0H14DRAFT_2601276 [Mycena olivaceomarginata]|nr:hypothetical protein B0H14DRAFT_2601276 [Mycena olivaceomarginata]
MRLGSSAEAAESQEYLVKTFSAAALPTMEEDGGGSSLGIGLEARRLATLQTTNAILINGGEHGAQNQPRSHARARIVKVARAQHPVPMDIDPPLTSSTAIPQKRRRPEGEATAMPGQARISKRGKHS